MKLTILERFVLPTILPEKGSYANLKLVREVREDLSFTAEEFKLYNIEEHTQGNVTWSLPTSGDPGRDIEFNDVITNLITAKFKEMDQQGSLEDKHISLYEKFIG